MNAPQKLPAAIGNYRVVAQLGQGGMARAYLAVRRGPGGFRKLFVIKQLRRDLPSETAFVEMFLDEARLAAMLSHPNVVQTHEVGSDGDDCFISMDYLEGQSLGRVLRRITRQEMPLALHVQILADVLAGLHYAHELKDFDGTRLSVVHRDVSPGNVFLTYDGQVKLLDFGIAKAVGANSHTEVGVLKGKLAYMAPEQALSEDVDRRTDIFAVGVMLWEALAQRRLVPRKESEPVTLHNRVNGLWEPISAICPNASAKVVAACDKAMALDPADRFETADEFRVALLDGLAECGNEPSRDDLAELVVSAFVHEREVLATKIAATIEAGAQLKDEPLLSRTPSSTDLPLAALEVELEAYAALDFEPESATLMRAASQTAPPARSMNAAIIGAIAVAAVGIAIFVYSRQGEPTASATAGESAELAAASEAKGAAQVTALEPTPEAKEAAPLVRVELIVDPPDSSLELDGEAIETDEGRAIRNVPRDETRRRLTASAPGYVSASRWVRFDESQAVKLSLVPVEERVVSAGSETSRARRRGSERARLADRQAAAARETAALAKGRESEEEPEADAAASALPAKKPKAGDSLEAPSRKQPRKIDEHNPYNK